MADIKDWSTVVVHVLTDSKMGSGQQKMNIRTNFGPQGTQWAVVEMIRDGLKRTIMFSSILQKKSESSQY